MYHTGTAIVSIRVNFLEVNVRIIRGLNVKSVIKLRRRYNYFTFTHQDNLFKNSEQVMKVIDIHVLLLVDTCEQCLTTE